MERTLRPQTFPSPNVKLAIRQVMCDEDPIDGANEAATSAILPFATCQVMCYEDPIVGAREAAASAICPTAGEVHCHSSFSS
mmetsp:Transcript_16690/g.30300  ORF Transcript_16690/g.30300 Transcript_16690/m.30300 type:complete len:82 (+) Transcript_16690:610-855(+)